MYKIRAFSFSVIHSSTLLLPHWCAACASQGLNVQMILCDVQTRWNSVYDMVDVAVKYRAAVDEMAADKALGLRAHELGDDEWSLLEDLLEILKVRVAGLVWNQRPH
jgi:hypothetical protein